jgi:hypothetical protein
MGEEPESISGLFARLADDAGALVRAEVELYRATALHRLALSGQAFAFIAAAMVIAIAAVCSLLVMLAIGLSRWVGPVGAGLIICLVACALSGILAKMGFDRLSGATDDKPETDQ